MVANIMRLKEEWNPTPWQLHASKWNLLNQLPTDYERYRHISEEYIYLPHTYDRKNVFSFLSKFCVKIMKTISHERTFGCLILAAVCLFFYMHIFMLDNSRETRIPDLAHFATTGTSRVVVAIVMHKPTDYLKVTLRSLNESSHQADVWIIQNFIGEYIYKDVRKWYPSANVISDEGREDFADTMDFVINKFISSDYDVLVSINSFSVLSYDWWNTLKKGLKQSYGIFTLYGTERDHIHAEICTKLLCNETWLGDIGTVWRRNLAVMLVSETSNVRGRFNYKMEYWCKSNGIPMQSVRKSVMAVINSDTTSYEHIRKKLSSRIDQRQTNIEEMVVTNGSKLNKLNISKDSTHLLSVENITRHSGQILSNKTDTKEECIAAVLRIRIHREDSAQITTYEVEQWIRYMQYAGVSIVYLYDGYEKEEEKLDLWVKQLFDPSEVRYHDWFFNSSLRSRESERIAYQHATFYYKDECKWHLQANVNEYPFMPVDVERGFLKRLVKKIKLSKPNCSEVSLPVFQYISHPRKTAWFVERIQNNIPVRAPGLERPLYIAKLVRVVKQSHNKLDKGISESIDPNIARIYQYMTGSLKNVEPDFDEPSSMASNDLPVAPILKHLKRTPLISNKMPLYVTNRFWDVNF